MIYIIKRINYFLQAVLIYLFFFIGRILGIQLSRKIFSNLFSTLGPFFKSKIIIKKNLNIFFKDNTCIKKNNIIKNMWRNYGMTFIEYIFLDHFKNNNSHVSFEGEENLQSLNQQPVIFVSGHFSNFELMSMEITKKNIQLATIYRPLNNFFFEPFYGIFKEKIYMSKSNKKRY